MSFDVPSTITTEQRRTAQAQMVHLSQTAEGQDKLAVDVTNAAAVAAGLTQSFINIGTKLQSVDDLNLQAKKFYPDWRGFREVRSG